MFPYGKKTAVASLILYVLTAAAIFLFSLMSGYDSWKLSRDFYGLITRIKFGEVKNEETETIKITSMEIVVGSDRYSVGSKTLIIVDKVTPTDYNEKYSVKTDDEAIAFYKDGYLFFDSVGTVNVWAESESGVRSNSITVSVVEKIDDDFIVDPEKLTVDLPDSMPVNDARLISVKYDGASPKFSLTCTVSGVAELVAGKFFVTKSSGNATVELKYKDELVYSKTVEVTAEVLPQPVLTSFYIDNGPIDGDIGLCYGSVYNAKAYFEENDCCKAFYLKSENKTLSFNVSAERDYLMILASAIGEDKLKVYSPVSPEEPLATFSVKTIPPYPNATGIKTNLRYVGSQYNVSLVLADKKADYGLTLSVEGGNGEDYEITDDFKITFFKEGNFTLVYRSTYYEDFEYRYEVSIADGEKENLMRKSVGHAALFVVLGVFATIAFCYFAKKPAFKATITALSGIAVAILSEVLQTPFFTSGRNASFADVLIDLGGFVAGVAFITLSLLAIYLIRSRSKRSDSSKTVE